MKPRIGLFCMEDVMLSINEKAKQINYLLKHTCEENGYFFIDIGNIQIRDLWKDGTHL